MASASACWARSPMVACASAIRADLQQLVRVCVLLGLHESEPLVERVLLLGIDRCFELGDLAVEVRGGELFLAGEGDELLDRAQLIHIERAVGELLLGANCARKEL